MPKPPATVARNSRNLEIGIWMTDSQGCRANGNPHMDPHAYGIGMGMGMGIGFSPWGFPQKSYGNGMEIPFPRQP